MDLNFGIKKHEVVLSPRARGDIEYKQRANWASRSRIKRERANLMFSRIVDGLYFLSNSKDFSCASQCNNGIDYSYEFTDGFAIIIFEPIQLENISIIYIKEFIWVYKKDPMSWWYIVDCKLYPSSTKEHLTESVTDNNVIRLTESDLKRIIIETLTEILIESA